MVLCAVPARIKFPSEWRICCGMISLANFEPIDVHDCWFSHSLIGGPYRSQEPLLEYSERFSYNFVLFMLTFVYVKKKLRENFLDFFRNVYPFRSPWR